MACDPQDRLTRRAPSRHRGQVRGNGVRVPQPLHTIHVRAPGPAHADDAGATLATQPVDFADARSSPCQERMAETKR
jgi:hypothetical protein